MNEGQKDSLISRRLAEMNKEISPPPEPSRAGGEKIPLPSSALPKTGAPRIKKKEKLPPEGVRILLVLSLGFLTLILFSGLWMYNLFASRLTDTTSSTNLPTASESAAPETASSAAVIKEDRFSKKEKEYAELARALAGKEDPFESPFGNSNVPAEEPAASPPPTAPPISFTLLGIIIDEPKMALVEITKNGESRRVRIREGLSYEGFRVALIDYDRKIIALTGPKDTYQISMGTTLSIPAATK